MAALQGKIRPEAMQDCACVYLEATPTISISIYVSIMPRLRVILGTTDFGRQKLAQDKPVRCSHV